MDTNEYVDQQLKFNKDIVKASTSIYEGLQRQATLNSAIAQQLEEQSSRIKTHRDIIIALAVLNLCNLALIGIGLVR